MSSEHTTSQHAPRNRWGPLWPIGEALRFLTVIPVPGLPPMTAEAIPRAIPYFPVAGLALGALLVAVGWIAGALWNETVRAIALVVVWGMLTAGLHLDGLSDTFDGVMSWRSRERKLEIMRDSRIGVMGALALAAVLGLKATFLATAGDAWIAAAALAPVLGRWADVYGIVRFPPAREGGLGRAFQSQLRPGDFVIASGTTLILALALGGARGLAALAIVWLVTHLLGRWWTRDLGGLTGDTYGALCEIAEVVVLATLTASIPVHLVGR
ncbi:adenosylcobinamide-GDP ribazoletransferase [Roseiflexus castenholzii]|jgi:adenosylcobinamide-GDP ribazoletransferase|uniref:Adenosylcobinamide-GDP ribazoletransferase n=2 Tax=Chloroflexota TaxID=200795 RepID=A7NFS6_ROSCS|nr:adenosylcobinamide-GDP ribazoletransferase [Roseiflexus castenholzii]ABU56307.1 cobalamin 5'-phosphate synthase [Roseiflexus castenholzii DSM 13941]